MPSSLIGYLLLIFVLTRRKMRFMLVRVSKILPKVAISEIVRISLVQQTIASNWGKLSRQIGAGVRFWCFCAE